MKKYYCGYDSSPTWIRKLLSIKFNASCRIHDLDYEQNSPFSQEEADQRFFQNMVKQSKGNLFWLFLACIFYKAVLIGGKKTYKNNITR
jgi:hypothetical protein